MAKRTVAALMALLMLCATAFAESYTGKTFAQTETVISANASATVEKLNAETGDTVTAGDVIATYRTNKVFATQDGTIARIMYSEGDEISGTVMELAPIERYTIYCTVDDAYESTDTMFVSVGETVYIKCETDGTHRAIGRITSVTGSEYQVLTYAGELYIGENVYLYRDEDFTKSERIGIGTLVATDTETYEAQGMLVKTYVEEDEYVERGEILYEYIDGDDTETVSEVTGIVTQVNANAGGNVREGDALMTIGSDILIEISVSETNYGRLKTGDEVEYVLANDLTETRRAGKVAYISRLVEGESATAWILPEETLDVIGMSVTVFD